MNEIELLRKRLRALGRKHWPVAAKAAGMSVPALEKFAYGRTRVPRADHYVRLVKHMDSVRF